jgi:hypothetical protein
VGEYIRTGLDFDGWCRNFRSGMAHAKHRRQMRIDFTLTLPGLFEVVNIHRLAQEFDVEVLAKVVFSFSPDIILSPLSLPRKLLDNCVNKIVNELPSGALKDVLLQLKNRPTFQEQWPNTWQQELVKGKKRVLQLESIRNDSYTLADILSQDIEILEWYENIGT